METAFKSVHSWGCSLGSWLTRDFGGGGGSGQQFLMEARPAVPRHEITAAEPVLPDRGAPASSWPPATGTAQILKQHRQTQGRPEAFKNQRGILPLDQAQTVPSILSWFPPGPTVVTAAPFCAQTGGRSDHMPAPPCVFLLEEPRRNEEGESLFTFEPAGTP